MKYWRGYLVAAIIAACSWGLIEFAQSHWVLVDMVYPYVTRMVQAFLTDWSNVVPFCLWQLIVLVLVGCVFASIVMMIIWKWNVVQWFGWVLAVISLIFFANTAIYGLNDYSGPINEDIRLEVSDYSISELEAAGQFYLEEANRLAQEINRDGSGNPKYPTFQEMTIRAGEGFQAQTYTHYNAIFAGTTVPVKELGWSEFFTNYGITGVTVGITGEAAVNPQTPALGLPFTICRHMAERMCISNDQDAAFAAFLACSVNSSVEFQYSAYFMAYRYCYDALASMPTTAAQAAAVSLAQGENDLLKQDLESYNASFAVKSDKGYAPAQEEGEEGPPRNNVADLLTAWHIQEYVIPSMTEETVLFDPTDESQVDLSGIVNAITDADIAEETVPEE